MHLTDHFVLMAKYNSRMNQQVYNQAFKLTSDQLHEDKGAFFGSIIGTLNHLLVGDLIWLSRFAKFSERYVSLTALSNLPKPTGLADVLYSDVAELFEARKTVDAVLIEWLDEEAEDRDLQQTLTYSNTKGETSTRSFAELISHLFNHQTHHRGQVSTLLSQYGLDIGVTDFLIDIPELQAV